MTVHSLLLLIENTPIAGLMRGDSGSGWWFSIVETIHVLSFAVVFGSILMVDLRLLGIASKDSAVSGLSSEILPYTWTAYVVAVICGTLMFVSKATTYFDNLEFRLKFLFMALAGINMLVFHFGIYRRVLEWDAKVPPPTPARIAGGLSIALWVMVIFMGRWVGYTTS